MKNKIYLSILLLCVFAIFMGYHIYNIKQMHVKIDINNVEYIQIYNEHAVEENRFASEDEIKDIINWFNHSKNIKRNDFSGTTSESAITIKLKEGIGRKEVCIYGGYLNVFEVQRYDKKGKYISYWGSQKGIENILKY